VILSKGHAAPALYAVLAETGLIPKEELTTLRRLGSRLQGHPDRTRLPEVEMSTGSLGQGLSVALGLALAMARRDEPHRSYAILGDGEMNSGQVWEAILFAGRTRWTDWSPSSTPTASRTTARSKTSSTSKPYAPKLVAAGWAVTEIDGQDVREVVEAYDWASSDRAGKKAAHNHREHQKRCGSVVHDWPGRLAQSFTHRRAIQIGHERGSSLMGAIQVKVPPGQVSLRDVFGDQIISLGAA